MRVGETSKCIACREAVDSAAIGRVLVCLACRGVPWAFDVHGTILLQRPEVPRVDYEDALSLNASFVESTVACVAVRALETIGVDVAAYVSGAGEHARPVLRTQLTRAGLDPRRLFLQERFVDWSTYVSWKASILRGFGPHGVYVADHPRFDADVARSAGWTYVDAVDFRAGALRQAAIV